jgi:uroporphyrinogen decarboxylase
VTLKNDRLLKALLGKEVDVTPVWMMRQAGRYLPEYRNTRKKAGDFMSLCQSPEMACEVALQPLRRYAFDAAILFSDILTIPDAMGQGLFFEAGEGPRFKKIIRTRSDVEGLPEISAIDDLGYVMDAVSLIRKELGGSVPLIGFSGSPWTLATYMIEGGGSKDFSQVKAFMYNEPEAMHLLLKKLTAVVIDYLNCQIRAGAQAVQIFDTWGGVLTTPGYLTFSLHYMKEIVTNLIKVFEGRDIPVILFTKNGGQWLTQIAEAGAHAIGIDWTTEIGAARKLVGAKCTLQGNMDPAVLYSEPEVIRREVSRVLSDFGGGNGHVFNLGHGITPGVDPEHVAVFVDSVHEFSAQYHT